MSREVTVTTPPSRSPRAWNGEGEVLGVVPLLGAQGRKEEAKVSLVAPEDVGPAEAEAVILARTPDEPLVVDVAHGGGMIEHTHRIRMHVSVSATTGRKAMCWEVYGCVCLRYLASALCWRSWRPVATPRWVCVCFF